MVTQPKWISSLCYTWYLILQTVTDRGIESCTEWRPVTLSKKGTEIQGLECTYYQRQRESSLWYPCVDGDTLGFNRAGTKEVIEGKREKKPIGRIVGRNLELGCVLESIFCTYCSVVYKIFWLLGIIKEVWKATTLHFFCQFK
jgi:hypothetical protein